MLQVSPSQYSVPARTKSRRPLIQAKLEARLAMLEQMVQQLLPDAPLAPGTEVSFTR